MSTPQIKDFQATINDHEECYRLRIRIPNGYADQLWRISVYNHKKAEDPSIWHFCINAHCYHGFKSRREASEAALATLKEIIDTLQRITIKDFIPDGDTMGEGVLVSHPIGDVLEKTADSDTPGEI